MMMFYEVTVTFTDDSYALAYAGTSETQAKREYGELCDRDDVSRVTYVSENTDYGRHSNYGTQACVYCDIRFPYPLMRTSDVAYGRMVCIDHDGCMLRIHERFHSPVFKCEDCAYCYPT